MRAWLRHDGEMYHVEWSHEWDRIPVADEVLLFADRSRRPGQGTLALKVDEVTWQDGEASLHLQIHEDSRAAASSESFALAGLHRFGDNPECVTCRQVDEGRIEGADWTHEL